MKKLLPVLLLLILSKPIISQENLLLNPGAENDFSNWTRIQEFSEFNWNITNDPVHSGSKSWISSYQYEGIHQTIDLIAKGYTTGALDAIPQINASVWIYPGYADYSRGEISFKVELLNESDGVIHTSLINENDYNGYEELDNSLPDAWFQKSGSLTGYPAGMRKIKITLMAIDGVGWGGNFGPAFDDVSIIIEGLLPVELKSFTAKSKTSGIELKWQTATETNNYGFEIERAVAGSVLNWGKIGFVKGNGNSNVPKSYSFTDTKVSKSSFKYRLKQVDLSGKYSYSDVVEVDMETPASFFVKQNYPNPFNPSTTIEYSIPSDVETMQATSLRIYDILGKEVAVLVNQKQPAGNYKVKFDASNLPAGVYLYKIQSGDFSAVKKLMLVK